MVQVTETVPHPKKKIMASLSANVSPKLSTRNSYTGSSDSADGFSDVFGGPPTYISSKQFKDPRKAHSFSQPSSGISGPVQSEIPVFGEIRKRYINDEFYNNFFNGDAVSNSREIMSYKCLVTTRSTSRDASPTQSPLPSNSVSPLTPKLRQPVNSSKQADYPAFGVFSHRGPHKFFNDSSVTSSSQSSLPDPSSDPLSDSKQGLKKQQEFGVFPPRSSKSRFQTFLERGETKAGSAARLSNDKLYSTAQTTPCSNTSDDESRNNIQGLNGHINRGVSKLAGEKHGSDNAKGSNSGEKDDSGSEKFR